MGQKATSEPAKRRRTSASEIKGGKPQDKEDGANSAPPNTPMGSMGPVVPKNPDLVCPHLSYVRLEKLKRKILTPTAWSCSGKYCLSSTRYATAICCHFFQIPHPYFFHHFQIFHHTFPPFHYPLIYLFLRMWDN